MGKNTLPVIELLKTHNANFSAVDHDGNTPLITMTMINVPLKYRPMLAQKLIEYGCLKDFKNKQGQTAFNYRSRTTTHYANQGLKNENVEEKC